MYHGLKFVQECDIKELGIIVKLSKYCNIRISSFISVIPNRYKYIIRRFEKMQFSLLTPQMHLIVSTTFYHFGDRNNLDGDKIGLAHIQS